jgi:SAM-dependent methyltransferase
MKPFGYAPREACICGARLDPAARVSRTYPPGTVSFLRCASCGSWCQSPRVTPETLRPWIESPGYYGSPAAPGAAYQDYFADEPQRLREAAYRWRRTLRHCARPGSRVLEIGCATGSVLRVLREQGCAVAGIDLSRRFADFARQAHGLEVECGDFAAADLGAARFDLVLLFGTFCNLPRLHDSLRKIRAHLAPGGALLFNFPDAGHWLARLYGRRFWMFAPTIDVVPTRRGCEAALRAAGLRLRSVETDRQSPSLGKLLKHARLEPLLAIASRLGAERWSAPCALPLPGIRLARAAVDPAR